MKTIVYLILVMMICSGCVPRAYRYEQPYEEKEDSFVEINYNKPYKGQPRSINDPRFVKERMEETKYYNPPPVRQDYKQPAQKKHAVRKYRPAYQNREHTIPKQTVRKHIYRDTSSNTKRPSSPKIGTQRNANTKNVSKIHK